MTFIWSIAPYPKCKLLGHSWHDIVNTHKWKKQDLASMRGFTVHMS